MNLYRATSLVPAALLLLVSQALPAGAMARNPERKAVADVPPQVEAAERVGRAEPAQPMERMILVLPSRDAAGRERFLAAQQTPGAPEFHKWLAPAEYHARFGARPEDVAAAEAWLAEQGFALEPGSPGRSALVFSGTASQVEAAFQTRMGLYAKGGEPRLANETPATVPASLARRVVGVMSLHGFARKQPLSHRALAAPLFNTSSGHALAPADFARVYGLDGVGADGTGAKIAVVGRTQINLDDTKFFRTFFGLPVNDPKIVLNGPDPGNLGSDEQFEANLDVQWSGGTAPGAAVTLVVSKSTVTTDGVDLSAQYAVEQNLADVVTVSFGACESDIGAAGMAFYENVWAQAAAQGIAVFVASGDSGAAGCDSASASSGTSAAVNGLSSSPWNTCVGGTSFSDAASPSTYWAPYNDGVTKQSALSYIPEATWNESASVAGGKSLFGTGGGTSITFGKPLWQAGSGMPDGSSRFLPDVSLAAAAHTPYLVVKDHTSGTNGLWGIYGTSASSPALAGIAARLVQAAGGRVGNLNPVLYALGRAQYAGTGPAVFHDVTDGHNGVPNVPGFAAGPGFDLATGFGSLDGAALFAAWPSAAPAPSLGADFLLGASPAALLLPPGKTTTVTVLLSTVSGQDAAARVSVSGLPSGITGVFAPTTANGAGTAGIASAGIPAYLTLSASASVASGTYPVTLTATAGSITRTVTVWVTVSNATTVPPVAGAETQVPVVLDVFGNAGSHYTSDLVVVNRGGADVTALLRFSGGSASGPLVGVAVPARRQLYVTDVVSFLAARGWTFPSGRLGTLYVSFAGVSDPGLVFAGSRISTPNQDKSVGGAFGTFASAVASGTASSSEAWVYGLKRNASFRSNLAVVHAPGGASSQAASTPVSVEVQLYDGASGAPVGAPVAHALQPGEFWQIDAFTAASASMQSAYVRVRRTAGTDRFITYGVVNDGGSSGGGTSDGSLVVSGGTDGLVPVVLDIPGATHYQTEISLTNGSTHSVTVDLVYTGSTQFGGGAFTQTASTTLAAGQQVQQENALAWLRGLGMQIPSTGSQGGTLRVTGAVAIARTWNPASDGNGTYGVAYPALDAAHRATSSAWVYGLRQDAEVRTNLAIADARVGDSATRDYVVEVYDADSGATSPVATLTRTLAGGQWTQLNTVLAGTGVLHGYARVRPSAASDFVAYGIVNDGPAPGSRTSDGSYVPMVVE